MQVQRRFQITMLELFFRDEYFDSLVFLGYALQVCRNSSGTFGFVSGTYVDKLQFDSIRFDLIRLDLVRAQREQASLTALNNA